MGLFAHFKDRAYYIEYHKDNNDVGCRAYNNLREANI